MKLLKFILSLALMSGIAVSAQAQDADASDSEIPGTYLQSLSGRFLGDSLGRSDALSLEAASGAGWHPMESFRLELEYTHTDRTSPRFLSPVTDDTMLTLSNARMNMKVSDWVTPYVGVGVGWTRTEAERMALGFSNSRSESLSYQGVIGLSVPFSEGFSFFADGRYLRAGEAAFTATDDFAIHGTAQTWTALAGVRFTFGQ